MFINVCSFRIKILNQKIFNHIFYFNQVNYINNKSSVCCRNYSQLKEIKLMRTSLSQLSHFLNVKLERNKGDEYYKTCDVS